MTQDESPFEASFNDEQLRREINEHRKATGHPLIRRGTSRDVLMRHIRQISAHAPYGNDPWSTDF